MHDSGDSGMEYLKLGHLGKSRTSLFLGLVRGLRLAGGWRDLVKLLPRVILWLLQKILTSCYLILGETRTLASAWLPSVAFWKH